MVMFDHKSGSYWQQVNGKAIAGTLTGEQLTLLPAQTTTWDLWLEQHPQTQVLSLDTGHQRNYTNDQFIGLGDKLNQGGDFIFPVSETARDDRLKPGEVVLGVEVGNTQRAYAIGQIGDGVINDTLDETPLVIFSLRDGPTGAAFLTQLENQTLTFRFVEGQYQDEQTDSKWSLSGLAVSGKLAGTQLEPLPIRSTFWFSLVTSFPDIELYSGN